MIQFNQQACLKEYFDMNIELRKHAKNDFKKDLFKLMNNSFFRKTFPCKEAQRHQISNNR